MPVQAYALTSLAAVRQFLELPSGDVDQDGVLEKLIDRASLAIMRRFEREFAPKAPAQDSDPAVARTFAYAGRGVLDLAPYDLRSATSVEIDVDTGAPTTLAAADYKQRSLPARDGVFTSLRLPRRTREREVRVTGRWSFASVPADVEHMCIVTVGIWFRRDVAAFGSTFSLDEQRLERPEPLPTAVIGMGSAYRRLAIA